MVIRHAINVKKGLFRMHQETKRAVKNWINLTTAESIILIKKDVMNVCQIIERCRITLNARGRLIVSFASSSAKRGTYRIGRIQQTL